MKHLIRFIIDALAVYRLTRLINEDYLLGDVRKKIWEKYPPTTKIGYLFTCTWCMSIWTGLGLLLIKRISPKFYEELSLLLAASTIAGVLGTKI